MARRRIQVPFGLAPADPGSRYDGSIPTVLCIEPRLYCVIAYFALPLLLIGSPQSGASDEFASPAAAPIRVDRGLQVTVFPDRLRLQYDLGLSPLAATALLRQRSHEVPAGEDRRALMEAVREMVLPDILRRCRLTADREPLELRSLESQLFPKHYVQLSCIFEASLPSSPDVLQLQLIDGSFRGCDGNHLIALKVEDGVQLKSSTVPLILARVPRQSLSNDSAAQREAARRAEAVVVRPTGVVDETREPPDDAPQGTATTTPPPPQPPRPPNRTWAIVTWVAGCCAGLLAVMAFRWLRG